VAVLSFETCTSCAPQDEDGGRLRDEAKTYEF